MLEVEVMSREANHVINRESHIMTMLVSVMSLMVLSLGDGGMNLWYVVKDELEASGCCGVGGVNEEGGREESVAYVALHSYMTFLHNSAYPYQCIKRIHYYTPCVFTCAM